MTSRKNKLKPKSREMIEEASDIVRNAEDDDAAVAFLRDTLTDDYPDLDLGSMNLHEATEILSVNNPSQKSKNMKRIEDLNACLGDFINKQENKFVEKSKKSKNTKRKSTRKRKSNKK